MKHLLILLQLLSTCAFAQNGVIRGKIKDNLSNENIVLATVSIQNTSQGVKSDTTGNFEIKNLTPGLYNIVVSYVGYKKKTIYEVAVDNSKPSFVEILLERNKVDVKELTVKARKDKTEESPLSLRTIGVNEIQRNPGGNRDISKVIQSLPGAGSSVGFRNDIIIRGGGPSENRFYLDGIEIPNINHFATQGANGGPVGILNVDFLQDVSYYSAAFPSNRGNTLSSVFDFKMKNPRSDSWHGAFTVGSSDIGLRAEGPLNKQSGLMLSIRRSYLKLLFSALELPFLPTYNDIQIKYKYNIDRKNELSYILIGAYDVLELNTNSNKTEQQKFILGNLPEQKQWNYTNGIVYKHYKTNSFQTIVLSRNMLNNASFKYNNNNVLEGKLFNFQSQEIENKLRIENTIQQNEWKINVGAGLEYVKFTNETDNTITLPNGNNETIAISSSLDFYKYNLFGQISRTIAKDKLSLSVGLRTDGNTYSAKMNNPWTQLSPRFSASYKLNPQWNLNFNTGRYYQTPAYTMLGYKDSNNQFINRTNNISFIQCTHWVGGVEYSAMKNSRFTIEAFLKNYNNYPQSLRNGLSLANAGGDFGVVGNEPVTSSSEGRAYGIEFFAQQKLYKGFYGLMAITLFRSEFTNAAQNDLTPSNWDQRYIINLTAGKKLKRNWEIGAKFRMTGGRPFTPYDTTLSSITTIWDINRQGLFDYTQVNANRLPWNHQLDVRIDKKYYFKRWNLNVFLDIQNLYMFAAKEQDILTVKRDVNGNPLLQPNTSNPARYQTQFLENTNGTLLPTLGIIIEY